MHSGPTPPHSQVPHSFSINISILPLEILKLIFAHTVPQTRTLDQCQAPRSLTQVCSDWAKLVSCLPALWDSLDLSFDFSDGKAMLPHEDAVKSWFRRAQGMPFSFSVSISPWYLNWAATPPFYRSIGQFWRATIPHLPRLRSLRVWGFTTAFTSLHDCLIDGPYLHDLQTLSCGSPYSRWNTRLFLSAPKLRSLTLSSSERGCYLQDLPIPWQQITSFDLSNMFITPLSWRRLLAYAQALQQACFAINGFEEMFINPPVVEVANLRKLGIILRGQIYQPSWADDVFFPSLDGLKIDEYDGNLAWLKNSQFLSQFHHIRRLSIRAPIQSQSDLDVVLGAASHVRQLNVDDAGDNLNYAQFFNSLTLFDGVGYDSGLLPDLEHLNLSSDSTCEAALCSTELMMMLMSRRSPLHRSLQSVALGMMIDDGDLTELEGLLVPLRDEGLDIVISQYRQDPVTGAW